MKGQLQTGGDSREKILGRVTEGLLGIYTREIEHTSTWRFLHKCSGSFFFPPIAINWKWKSKLLSCVRLFLVNDKWDTWMASPTQWTRRSLSKHQETVKDREAWPLQSMGLQSQTWHSNWTTASNWIHSIFLRIFLGSLSIIWVGFHISFKVSVHLFILCILLLPLLFKLLSLY